MCRAEVIQDIIPYVATRRGINTGWSQLNHENHEKDTCMQCVLSTWLLLSLITLVYLREHRTHGGKRLLTASIVGELQQEFAGKVVQAGSRPE